MDNLLTLFVWDGLVILFSTISIIYTYRKVKKQRQLSAREMEIAENDLLDDLQATNAEELEKTVYGRELLDMLQTTNIFEKFNSGSTGKEFSLDNYLQQARQNVINAALGRSKLGEQYGIDSPAKERGESQKGDANSANKDYRDSKK